jgi:hypothetical protein
MRVERELDERVSMEKYAGVDVSACVRTLTFECS